MSVAEWLKRRPMTGGLYFGPAGWVATGWEQALPAAGGVRRLALPAGWDQKKASSLVGKKVLAGEQVVAGEGNAADVIACASGTLTGSVDTGGAAFLELTCDGDHNAAVAPGVVRPESVDELILLLRSMGLGRTSDGVPSLLSQLMELAGRRAVIVLNWIASEPESQLGRFLASSAAEDVVAGAELLHKLIPHTRFYVVSDRHDRGSQKCLRAIRPNKGRQTLRRVRLLNRYPQAHPTPLLRSLLALKLQVGQSPVEKGVVMIDPLTCWALGKRLRAGEVFTRRPVQIFQAGEAPRITLADLGTPLSELCGLIGGDPNTQCIVNGMMAGRLVDPHSYVVGSDTESISLRPIPAQEFPTSCIDCGWCVDHCPTAINPATLYHASSRVDFPKSGQAFEATHCIDCGLCSYVCPARLPLTELIVALRKAVVQRRTETSAPVKPGPDLTSASSAPGDSTESGRV